MSFNFQHFGPDQLSYWHLDERMFLAMEKAFIYVARNEVMSPPRQYIPLPAGGISLVMAARVLHEGHELYAAKIFNDCPNNRENGRGTFQGLTTLFDSRSGLPLATFDAAALTAVRTGVSAAVATLRFTSLEDQAVGVIGVGPQAIATISAIHSRSSLSKLFVHPRHLERWRNLITEWKEPIPIAELERRSPVKAIVTATSATSPVFTEFELSRDVHISALGSYRPDMRELDPGHFEQAHVFVDNLAALKKSGDLLQLPDDVREKVRLVGEVFTGNAEVCPGEQTLYKSVGHPCQDVLAAWTIWNASLSKP